MAALIAITPLSFATPAMAAEVVTDSLRNPSFEVEQGDEAPPDDAPGTAAFRATIPTTDGLVTNEFEYWNPEDREAVASPDWTMTSGSLFSSDGWLYSGRPDVTNPDAHSRNGTNSAIFRMNSRRYDFDDVTVGFRFKVNEISSTRRTPWRSFDGVHVWLRYQNEESLYLASVARRDGAVVIKKKCPGGPSNGGTYYPLTRELHGNDVTLFDPMDVSVKITTNPDGTVTIVLTRDGAVLATGTDPGVGCAPITRPGAVGLRGDNTRFLFTRFTVTEPQAA
jgi:hypothetical protein